MQGQRQKCWRENRMRLEGSKIRKRPTDRMWHRAGSELAAQTDEGWVELA